MYTYIEIKDLLSPAATKYLADSDIYSKFKTAAESIVFGVIGNITKTDSTLQPFVWIMEYLIDQKMAGISEAKAKYDKDNYDAALSLLKVQNSTKITGSNVGSIDIPYSNEV